MFNLTNCIMLKNFIPHYHVEVEKSVKQFFPTIVLDASVDSDGRPCVVSKVLELQLDPSVSLTFDDFKLSYLISHGIHPRHLAISPDGRLGNDVAINEFNDYLEANADKFFNVES